MKVRFSMNCQACYTAQIDIPEEFGRSSEAIADYINDNKELLNPVTWDGEEYMDLVWLEDEPLTVEDLEATMIEIAE